MAKKKQAAGKMVRVAEGIYQRGDAFLVPIYHAELNDGNGGKRWHGLGCGPGCGHEQIVDRETAKAAKRQLEEQKRAARGRGQPDKTVGEWAGSEPKAMPEWLIRFPRDAQSTMQHNAERVRGFARAFPARSLRSLTEAEVWEWCTTNPSYVKELRACFNDAIRLKLMDENPLEHFNLGQRRGRSDIETLTVRELDELLLPTARREWRDYGENMEALIELGAWTGMRPGELFMLSMKPGARVNHVDLERGMIDVQWQFNAKTKEVSRPKWKSMREVVLLPRARAAIGRLPVGEGGFLFLTQRLTRFSQRHLHYYWDPVRRAFVNRLPGDHWLPVRMAEAEAVGKDNNLDFYELRHFFGTALAHPPVGIRPATPYEIAQQMGHKDGGALAMKTYIHTKGLDVVRDLSEAWADHAPRRRRGVA